MVAAAGVTYIYTHLNICECVRACVSSTTTQSDEFEPQLIINSKIRSAVFSFLILFGKKREKKYGSLPLV